jgi:hypothetical protein
MQGRSRQIKAGVPRADGHRAHQRGVCGDMPEDRAVSSIYGIDILPDNVRDCRRRLFEVFEAKYTRVFRAATKNECREADCLVPHFSLSRVVPVIYNKTSNLNVLKVQTQRLCSCLTEDAGAETSM